MLATICTAEALNILAGNEINLTTKNLSINSNNFKVDKNGEVSIRKGSIKLGGTISNGETVYAFNADINGNLFINGSSIDNATFSVTSDGIMTAKYGTAGGWYLGKNFISSVKPTAWETRPTDSGI